MKTHIYALVDPRDGEIRYVGKADNPKKRCAQHVREAQHKSDSTEKLNWLRELAEKGLKPEVRVLETIPLEEWPDAEVGIIEQLRMEGAQLTNSAPGGAGPINWEERF
ncbi:MAG: GIY-YIG nuclease family protein, partial [Acidobacteriota bacterium]